MKSNSLVSLDLRNFDTSKVTEMINTFFNCISLEYLNIYSFDTSNTINITNMFYGCISLLILNMYNFKTSSLSSYDNVFKNINKNLIICINDNNMNNTLIEQFSFTNDCNFICLKGNKKYFKERSICVKDCSNYQIDNPDMIIDDNVEVFPHMLEYNNICVEKCPNGTFLFEDKICKKYYTYHNENFTDIPEGYYIIDNNLNYIDKCNIKCKYCTKESMQNNLCIACNTSNLYFPKFDNTNNEFINCYNSSTIGDGYFLDDSIYMPCYPTCKKCTKMGTLTNQECTSCYSNYILNEANCDKCNHYYYFNSLNEKKCTTEDKCPTEYSKLIIEEGRCTDDCKNENIYKYEYENKCYESYPQDSTPPNNTSCTVLYFFKRICKVNNTDINKTQDFILDILASIKNGDLNGLLSNVIGEYKEDIIIVITI